MNLEYISRLVFDMFKIPVFLLGKNGEMILEHSIHFQHNLFDFSKETILNQLFSEGHTLDFPVFSTTAYLGNFFSINIRLGEEFHGKIIVGPVLFSNVPKESIKGIVNDFQLRVNKEELIHYYHSLPVYSHLDFIHLSTILFYMIYQQELDVVNILQNNKLLGRKRMEIEQPDVHVSERRQEIMTYVDPLYEKRMFECVKEGKKFELIQLLQESPKEGKMGVLSKTSQLRSVKNLTIAGITLATRSAIDGGLMPDVSYTLSDLFIQKIEELNDYNAVMKFFEYALLEFTERVQKGKKHKYSKPINICQNYIYTHLYQDICLSDLADLVQMNPQYLSHLFKKEVGISIIEFIQQVKVDEAKTLLTYTQHSLTEISSLLNFHDQSYFIKVFKKFAGVTPNQFKKGIISNENAR
ncbi:MULTISPECIES: helix-turn-helix domain-containing protein [unclassified Bacillus (in: firmicutes)]|uniref:helix-turn-helix domain-containing protein n=2 Tax=Bacillus TaxID=1386 RepID=UPI001BED135A|nr:MULTISPECIES: helix-turn-helix domain-containing protein [unclassified Bacillus (in: firmicutes)]MBT2723920.1 helix-turn-helix domain-containing protein [Bacillus sp. ISL-46]MBT2744023.1 helix-turn-helix domain-containing protein [Bacillus sp. ISL-77]